MKTKPKYQIGDYVYFVTSSCNYSKQINCPMCDGKCFVTIILGNGEHQEIQCGYCQRGIDPPSGKATTWGPESKIQSGSVSGIEQGYDHFRYKVNYHSLEEHELFDNEDDAKPIRDEKLKQEIERSKLWFRDNFINAKKKQVWSAGYHKKCIEDAERTIDWHKMRLCMIKDKSK